MSKITQTMLEDALAFGRAFAERGRPAQYIPYLRHVDPGLLGVCVQTADGRRLSAGDARTPFTVQSIAKVVALALALQDRGEKYLFSGRVGLEPTGDPFNSIIRLETDRKPYNPFINAGAIAVVGAIKGRTGEEKYRRLLDCFRRLCGSEEICLCEEAYRSERETGDKNRALAYHLKATKMLEGDVIEDLDVYFRMCSLYVTAEDIAHLALVLACRGMDPSTGERLMEPEHARIIRTLMLTCGMYDGSGEFAVKVGYPAKSGVGGGIAATLVDRMGIGVFGPALDVRGNSIAGTAVLEYLAGAMDIRLF
jgi:glutaminase